MEYLFIVIIISLLILILLFFTFTSLKRDFYMPDVYIPNILFQTYKSYDLVPYKVKKNIQKYASGYDYIFYDDEQCEQFLKNYYPYDVNNAYKILKIKAHKADLIRYCFLYIYGGVYIDIKTELMVPLKDIINKKYTYTCLGAFSGIYQGILATKKNNPLFLELINHIVNTTRPSQNLRRNYTIYTDYFMKIIKDNIVKDKVVKPGLNIIRQGKYDNIYLFQEECAIGNGDCYDGKDRYGLCCYIYDNGKRIFKTRYSDFPWSN